MESIREKRFKRKKLARLVSAIINPFSVSLVMIFLLSFRASSSTAVALKWALISVALSVLPLLVIILYLVRHEKIEGIFIKARRQRHKIYLLAVFCALVSLGILFLLDAPTMLQAAFYTALLAIVLFMCINLWWKISVHTGFATAAVTLLIILYGGWGLVAALVLPLVGWSRVELEHHSPAQVAAGAALSALTVVVVFYLLGPLV